MKRLVVSPRIFNLTILLFTIIATCVLQYYFYQPAHADVYRECERLKAEEDAAFEKCHQPYQDWQNAIDDAETAMIAVCTGAFVAAMVGAALLPNKTARKKAEYAASSALAVCLGGITTVLIASKGPVKRAKKKFDDAVTVLEEKERAVEDCEHEHWKKYHSGENPPGHS